MNWRGLFKKTGQWSDELREEAREHVGDKHLLRVIVIGVCALVLLLFAVSWYWSREPAPFEITATARKMVGETTAGLRPGVVTTAAAVKIVATLLDKPGGFINNDIAPPGVWLDDMPSWERGALQQVRDLSHALLNDFSQVGANADPDEDLARAEPRLMFSDNSWMLPSSESQYGDAREYLSAYLLRLQRQDKPLAQFQTTPAALDYYLALVSQRLDDISQRLSACVAPSENPALSVAMTSRALTPSGKIDDVFYEARGSAWALTHILRAIDVDFAQTLHEKQAQIALQEAIRALDATQDRIYSPMILNGSGFGLLANHSLVMASYIARADAAVATVRRLLAEPAISADATPH